MMRSWNFTWAAPSPRLVLRVRTEGMHSLMLLMDKGLAEAVIRCRWVDFLDTTGTLYSMANFINNYVPGGAQVGTCARS